MNILFVTRGFPSENRIMAGNYEAVQAKALAAKGCQVSVITIRWRSIPYLFTRSRISHRLVDNVDVYECIRIRLSTRICSFPKIDKFLSQRSWKKIFSKYVEGNGLPDIVHAHIVTCAAAAAFLKTEYHLPFVITEHWSQTFVNYLPQWLVALSDVYHQADKVICVSQALADSLKRNFQIESIVINNMVSSLFFQSSKKERNDNAFKFIACGAFRKDRNKGFDILVDAFAFGRLPKNVCLDIIGDGPDRPYVESKIADYNLGDQIKLLGVKTPTEVSDLLCNSDCFVLSSRLETFSIVVIEAMAKGLPVVATKCGGPETFLLPEHGILVEKENTEELADAMNYMLGHFSEYDSQKIRKYCYDHFSQDVIADQIIGVYNKVLNNH